VVGCKLHLDAVFGLFVVLQCHDCAYPLVLAGKTPRRRDWEKGNSLPALLIKTSSLSIVSLTVFAAARTEELSARSSWTKSVLTSGLLDLISSMTGWILLLVRPARMMSFGLPAAR